MGLLDEWRNWNADSCPPFVLEADAAVIKSSRNGQHIVVHRGWDDVGQYSEFLKPGEERYLHLGLLPTPFMGDMINASIYVLMLNPGLDKGDYYGEYEAPECRQALVANLKQDQLDNVLPFPFLDPQFNWHGGFKYWNGRLKGVIQELAKARGTSFEKSRVELGEKLSVIELFPYHSASFDHKWLRRLPSVELAGEFVRETVSKRVKGGQAIVIAVRGLKYWDRYLPKSLTEGQGIIRYPSRYAQAASFNPRGKSPGGRAILRHLGASTENS